MTAGKTPAAAGGGSTTSTQAYGEAWYWDNRYAQDPSTFDWYQKYPSLAPLIRLYIPLHHPILVVGCGNSGNPLFSLFTFSSLYMSFFLASRLNLIS